ncbi:diaminopimelate decarboxylase [Planobispora rosea]|uniref:Diaminopimelate decarboxylase n=1 Tax=Planobispora rosea TaxID=35762 RepID=A0A8J3WE62_PLARO|nr:decarboxylase [Planobispora rosea]GGS59461.1 diaminopimelate decarboxylase [Planobispora rosea]GIH84616.1 diaminopimelate decarboxylase [Planobispora rosea]
MIHHEELAARYGTPLYVYDLDEISAARRDLFDALPEPFALYYAIKANAHPDVVRAMREGEGRACRAEISSTGELAAALAAGFSGADCLYTGPGKTEGEVEEALAKGVRRFSAESAGDFRRIAATAERLGLVAECLLRVNSASASATTSIRMTGRPSQFGFDAERLVEEAAQLTGTPGARIVGLHLFPLSNAQDEESLIAEFRGTIALAARIQDELGIPFELVDIGGGFAAPYGEPGERPVYRRLRRELEDALDEHLPTWRAGAPELACESGRYLTATCGSLAAEVVNVKDSRGKKFAILDAGINTFGGMSGLGRLLPPAVQLAHPERAERETASLVGPLCTPGDVIGREVELPVLRPGDLIVIPNAGAYGVTSSLLMFLGRPAPVEIAVRGGEVVSATRIEHHRVGEPARLP